MNELPVYMTVSAAFEYLFGEIDTIFRLTWVPLLLGAIGTVALLVVGSSLIAALPLASQPAASLAAGFLAFLISSTAIAIAAVAVMRAILFNDRQPGRFIVCAFGRTELLFLIVPLVFYVIQLGVSFGGIGGSPSFPASSIATMDLVSVLPILAVAAVVLAIGVFVSVRLSMLYPAIVATDRFALREALALTRRRFWRLLAVFVLGLLFGSMLTGIVAGLLTTAVSAAIPSATPMPADAAVLVFAAQAVVFLVALVFFTTIQASLAAHAYKALKGYAPDQFLPSDAPAAQPPLHRPATP